MAEDHLSAGGCVTNVPAFLLAEGTVLVNTCVIVGRVYLDGQVFFCIYELYKEGKTVTVVLSEKVAVRIPKCGKSLSFVPFGDTGAFAAGLGTDGPAFAGLIAFRVVTEDLS